MWEESQRSAIIFSVHRLSIWQTVALEEKVLDDPRKHCRVPHQPLSQQYTQGQTLHSHNLQNTIMSAAHHFRILHNFRAVKRDPVELKYGICMEIVFLSSITTCFVDNYPNCFRIPLGREAKRSNTYKLSFHRYPLCLSALCSSDSNITCYCMPWTIIFQCYNNFLFSQPRKGSLPSYLCLLSCSGVTVWPEEKKKARWLL